MRPRKPEDTMYRVNYCNVSF
uniref:Uncharacterized protein n=1 Tax=Anguilla anguilla TaxID=7936 RepID=A0A0E9R5C8_ANGAN